MNLRVTVDDEFFRHDICNDDVRRVYPHLPSTPQSRLVYVIECDRRAYETIKHEYPEFTPPHHSELLPCRTPTAPTTDRRQPESATASSSAVSTAAAGPSPPRSLPHAHSSDTHT